MELSKHILIVEDHEGIRTALAALLEAAGYRVTCAANGRDAVDYLRQADPPFAILLDLNMPVMDGRQFRIQQRQHPNWARVPVVVISAEPRIAEEAAFLGAVDYLRKPVELDALLEAIRMTA